jgi:hypothetical protein
MAEEKDPATTASLTLPTSNTKSDVEMSKNPHT